MLPASSNATAQNPAATVTDTSSASSPISTTTAAPRVRSISNADNAALLRLDTISTANKFLKAVADGDINTAKKLMLEGASVDLTDSDGNTVLAIAARNGNLGMMEALLIMGADPDGTPKNPVQRLVGGISMGAGVRQALGGTGWMAAMLAFGNVGFFAGLLAFYAMETVCERAPVCTTPLILAARHGQTEAVKLLRNVATIDFTDSRRHTALMYAAHYGHLGALNALLEKGARTDHTNNAGRTALMFAAENGKTDMLEPLLSRGAKIDDTDRCGRTALILAAGNNQTETVIALLGKGPKVDHSARYTTSGEAGETIDDGTALIFAARKGHIGPIQELLKAGANVLLTPHNGQKALDIAKMEGYVEAAQILREASVKASIKALG